MLTMIFVVFPLVGLDSRRFLKTRGEIDEKRLEIIKKNLSEIVTTPILRMLFYSFFKSEEGDIFSMYCLSFNYITP